MNDQKLIKQCLLGNLFMKNYLGGWCYSWVLQTHHFTIINSCANFYYNSSFLGSGFALSDASKVSGLSKWLGGHLSALQVLPPFAILVIVCFLTTWTVFLFLTILIMY
jgi:hypothetical protein